MVLTQGGARIVIYLSQVFFLKSSRKKFVKSTYFYSKNVLKRFNNTPLMYVRAPKHFKSGKQHFFYFRARFLKTFVFLVNNRELNLSAIPGDQLFSTVTSAVERSTAIDYTTNKITVHQDVFLKIV